jgi:signal transduction histidine kinase
MTHFSINRWLSWLEMTGYALVFLPFLTDFIETGHWPQTPRDLVTEVTLGLLVLFYVRVIRRARRRLNRMEETRKDLTALLLHDMTTPLSVVMGTLSHLEEHPDDPERRKWIRAALRSCREDVELMTQLVEADQLEGRKFSVEKRPVDLPELLRSCAEEISGTTFKKNIAFTVFHAPDVGTVSADEGLLKRVLMNLMRNALKFTKTGGRLDVRAEIQRGWLVVKVQDSGIGIPQEHMNRLFERFSRVPTEDGEAREGWGLGLYFCKLAVEAHGGRIDVHSHPGQGTLVRFTIPLNESSVKNFEEIGLSNGVETAP